MTILLNYHIGRIVLGSLCVGVSVWLGWSGIRVAGFSLDVNILETISYLHSRDCPSKLTHVSLNLNPEDGRNIPFRNRIKS